MAQAHPRSPRREEASSIRSGSTSSSGAGCSCSAPAPTWWTTSTCRALRWSLILLFMMLKAGLIVAVFMHMAWERLALAYAILLPPLRCWSSWRS